MPDPRPRSHRIAPVLILLAASASLASFSHGQGVPATDPLLRLKAGNERFVRAVADHAPVTVPSTPVEGAPTAAVLSCADQRMSPEVMGSSPAIIRSNVDLPQPEGPTRMRNSPAPISMLTSLRTCVPPKFLATLRIFSARI